MRKFRYALLLSLLFTIGTPFADGGEGCRRGARTSHFQLGESVAGSQFLSLVDARNDSWFRVGADSVWLTHSGGSFRSQILDPAGGGVQVSQDLDHGFPLALRFHVGCLLLENLRSELSYLGTDAWSASATVNNLSNLDANISYDAELHNIEWNFIGGPREIDSFWWLAGFRYLQYQDSFLESYRFDPGVGGLITETATGGASNEAFGPQAGFGLDLDLSSGGGTFLRVGAKLALMNNEASQTGPSYANALVIDGTAEPVFNSESNEFAWLGDVEVSVTHFVTRHLSFRAGYQGLFFDNAIASATQTGAPLGTGQISFHGLLLGLELHR